MTEITVRSNICGYVHKVKGKLEGSKISIEIETPCPKIEKFSGIQVPKKEVFGIRDNFVIRKAEEADCSPTCIVPSAILHACWLEAGFMARSLAEKAGNICMEFDAVDQSGH